jgi:hypothetical protein
MWLINSRTLQLEEFPQNIPDYVILSHKWGGDEVSFQDMRNRRPQIESTSGFAKIQGCCAQACSDGFDYVWIDTCCIDKSSSSELSESINSMYMWYQASQVCYAYLPDVPSEEEPSSLGSSFAGSVWFTRCWTLQELIAPPTLQFYAKDWLEIGTKSSLRGIISTITGIHEHVLDTGDLRPFSVAQKMSWASKRESTRREDTAYCLLGMFGVNMPLIYGEGERAFARLQEEIMKSSDDHTLFAWRARNPPANSQRGALASSPSEFIDSRDIRRSHVIGESVPYSTTNRGLRMRLPLLRQTDKDYIAILNCSDASKSDNLLGLYLKISSSTREVYFGGETERHSKRVSTDKFYDVTKSDLRKYSWNWVYLQEPSRNQQLVNTVPRIVKLLITTLPEEQGYRISKTKASQWNSHERSFHLQSQLNGVAFVGFEHESLEYFVIAFGLRRDLVWADIVTGPKGSTFEQTCTSYHSYQRSKPSDRITKCLDSGHVISVTVRKQVISRETLYTANVCVKAEPKADIGTRDNVSSSLPI